MLERFEEKRRQEPKTILGIPPFGPWLIVMRLFEVGPQARSGGFPQIGFFLGPGRSQQPSCRLPLEIRPGLFERSI